MVAVKYCSKTWPVDCEVDLLDLDGRLLISGVKALIDIGASYSVVDCDLADELKLDRILKHDPVDNELRYFSSLKVRAFGFNPFDDDFVLNQDKLLSDYQFIIGRRHLDLYHSYYDGPACKLTISETSKKIIANPRFHRPLHERWGPWYEFDLQDVNDLAIYIPKAEGLIDPGSDRTVIRRSWLMAYGAANHIYQVTVRGTVVDRMDFNIRLGSINFKNIQVSVRDSIPAGPQILIGRSELDELVFEYNGIDRWCSVE